MAKFRLSPNAEEDLYRIWLYGVENWGMEAADNYQKEIFEKFTDIANNPMQYPSVEEIRDGYRRCMCGRDCIYFRVSGEWIDIMAILGQQDIDGWLQ